MKMIISARPIGPCMESETLLKFIIKKCHEIIEQNRREPSPDMGIPDSSCSCPRRRILQPISSKSSRRLPHQKQILGMCKNIFLPALDRLDGVKTPEWVDAKEKYPPAKEKDYKRLLLYALREGEKMLASRDYEFVRVFEILAWIGLQYYALQAVPVRGSASVLSG